MPVSVRGSHKRLPYQPPRPKPGTGPRLPPLRPRSPPYRRPPLPRFPGRSPLRLPPGIGGLAPIMPTPWQHGPMPVTPGGFKLHGPCMNMIPSIEFYRWTGTAVTSASCISGQAVGGGPNGGINERYGHDASWNIVVPQLGAGYYKRGYFGVYHLSGDTWRGQHRLSIEKFNGTPAMPGPLQLYPMRFPVGDPLPDPNNWPRSPNFGAPEAGNPAPGAGLSPGGGAAPGRNPTAPNVTNLTPSIGVTDLLAPSPGNSLVTETAAGPIGGGSFSPGKPPQPIRLGPTAPPGKGVKETKKQRGSAALGRLLFKALDNISESCEVVDSLFDALPDKAKKAAMKKAGYVWSPSAKKYVLPGDGSIKASDKTTDAFRPAGAGSRAFVDQFGQYGIDGCDWKAAALYQYADQLDVCSGLQNILKNYLEDKIHGVTHKYRPKNTVNGLADADKEFGIQLNELLDEVLNLCPK